MLAELLLGPGLADTRGMTLGEHHIIKPMYDPKMVASFMTQNRAVITDGRSVRNTALSCTAFHRIAKIET